jgi:hypothetical protein
MKCTGVVLPFDCSALINTTEYDYLGFLSGVCGGSNFCWLLLQ